MQLTINEVGTTPVINILAFHHIGPILISSSPINESPFVVSFVGYFINYLPFSATTLSFMHYFTTDLTVRPLLRLSAR